MKRNEKLRIVAVVLFILCTVTTFSRVGNTRSRSRSRSSSSRSYSSRSYSSSSSRSYRSGRGFGKFALIMFAAPFIMVGGIMFYVSKNKEKFQNGTKTWTPEQDDWSGRGSGIRKYKALKFREEGVLTKVREVNDQFSKYEFQAYVKELVLRMEEGVEDRDLSGIGLYLDENYYNKLQKEVEELLENDSVKIFNNQNTVDVFLKNYKEIDGYSYLDCDLYIIEERRDIKDKKIVEGSSNNESFAKYRVVLYTKKGNEEIKDGYKEATSCPSCGAPNKITRVGECDFCGSKINNGNFTWVIESIERTEIPEEEIIVIETGKGMILKDEVESSSKKLMEEIPEFSIDGFKKTVGEGVIKLQEAWSNNDMEIASEHISYGLKAKLDLQLEEYREKLQRSVVEKQEIKGIKFMGYEKDGNKDQVKYLVSMNSVAYVINDFGMVREGSKDQVEFGVYLVRYKRNSDKELQGGLTYCPSCGGKLENKTSPTCEYCGTTLLSGDSRWRLDTYEGVSY